MDEAIAWGVLHDWPTTNLEASRPRRPGTTRLLGCDNLDVERIPLWSMLRCHLFPTDGLDGA